VSKRILKRWRTYLNKTLSKGVIEKPKVERYPNNLNIVMATQIAVRKHFGGSVTHI
jgi:hypothetical protein